MVAEKKREVPLGLRAFSRPVTTGSYWYGILIGMDSNASLIEGRFVVPQVVASHFHIREGDTVVDLGAGSGYFLPVLVERVGATGTVLACEIQKTLVEKLGNLARQNGWSTVQPIWSDLEEVEGTKIPSDSVDVALMVNTFFQLEDKPTALAEVERILRPGGKFFVIDWSESFGGLGPQPGDVVSAETAEALVETAGFVLDRSFDAGDHHYGLAFRKP